MKKQNFSKSVLAFMLGLSVLSLSSCGGDDEGGSSSGSKTAGQIENTDGEKLLVTEAGSYKFYYDDDNLLENIYDGNTLMYEVSYNPFTMKYEYEGSYYVEQQKISDVSFNGKGYITKLKYKESYVNESDNYSDVVNSTVNFSYDGDGHLTKISGSEEGYEIEDGTKISFNASGSYTLTWKSGRLMKIVGKVNEEEGTSEESLTFSYDDDDIYPNLTHQFPQCCWYNIESDNYDWMAALGLIGRGGDYLPSSAEYLYEANSGDEDDDESNEFDFSYTFNLDGSLRSESIGRSTYRYSYDTLSEDDEDEAKQATRSAEKAGKHHVSRFFHKKH